MDITVRAVTAELASKIANGVVTSSIDWRVEAQTAVIHSVSDFLDEQILALEADVRRLEKELQEAGAKARPIGPLSYAYRYGYGANTRGIGSVLSFRSRQERAQSIELLPARHPDLAITEAYRSLATGLLLSSADELKAVAIASSEPGEGKSVTSANLAIVLAQLGMRVLLIDADFRKPHLHRLFDLEPELRAVHVIAQGVDPTSVIIDTSVAGLSLCPTGLVPPNPFALVASKRFAQFVTWGREEYDFVVIDTPPVLAVPDASFIGCFADGVVLCVQAGRTTRERLRACHNQLKLADVRILGSVLNRCRTPGSYFSYACYPISSEEKDIRSA